MRTLYDLYCPYFLPEVMVKFTRRVTGHFVMLIESGLHLFDCFLDVTQMFKFHFPTDMSQQ